MARARTIKPGLWLNEELADVSITARYFFPALWCHADRDGRLEFRPKKLKAEVFPYDNVDVVELAVELHGKKFISVYESGGKLFVQIANFAKHQNPHPKEKSEGYPDPVNVCNYDSNLKQFIFAASNVKLPFPSSSYPPIMDTEETETKLTIPYQEILDAFNKFCPSLPKALEVNSVRYLLIKAAYEKYQHHDGGPLHVFDTVFKKAERSSFLKGKIAGKDGRTFKAKFDWIFDLGKMAKILEGDYDDPEAAAPAAGVLTRDEEIAYLKREGLLS